MKTKSPNSTLVPLAIFAFAILSASLPETANAAAQTTTHPCLPGGETSRERFVSIMQTIAEGWNTGNARLAASCFAQDAFYSAPPSSGRRGRRALYEYFGGAHGRALPMHMRWHNFFFDPAQQIGAGEYTFRIAYRLMA